MDIPGLVSILMYNSSASPVLLVCDLSYNVTSPTDLSNNFLFPNNYEIPILWTLLRNSCYPPGLTLSLSRLQKVNLVSFYFLSYFFILFYFYFSIFRT